MRRSPMLLAAALLALQLPGPAHAKCATNSLDEQGFCRGEAFHLGKTYGWGKGSTIARDPYRYTRHERVDYAPIVRGVHVQVTGLEPQRSVKRYYVMRMQGGWTREEVARDIGIRYGRRAGSVVVGPLASDPADAKEDAATQGHD